MFNSDLNWNLILSHWNRHHLLKPLCVYHPLFITWLILSNYLYNLTVFLWGVKHIRPNSVLVWILLNLSSCIYCSHWGGLYPHLQVDCLAPSLLPMLCVYIKMQGCAHQMGTLEGNVLNHLKFVAAQGEIVWMHCTPQLAEVKWRVLDPTGRHIDTHTHKRTDWQCPPEQGHSMAHNKLVNTFIPA